MRRLGLVRVSGRSMRPTLRDGDLLVVRYDALPRPGDLVLVRLPAGPRGPRPVAVKRVGWREPGGWWVERDNPTHGVDSWAVGAIADPDVLAVVLGRLWPPRPGRSRSAMPD